MQTAWKRHVIDDSSRGADGIRLADVNGDGLPDIATGWEEGGTVRVYINPGPAKAGDKWPAVTVGRVGDVEDAVFADLDGDGAVDVVSCCEGKTKTMFIHWAPCERTRFRDEQAWQTEPLPASIPQPGPGGTAFFTDQIAFDLAQAIDFLVGRTDIRPIPLACPVKFPWNGRLTLRSSSG